jgi:DNA helicase-2/ATP-dependent DNA helicase PcrA
MPLDKYQRALVRTKDSCIVLAAAGSGKSKLVKKLGAKAKMLKAGTIHSISFKIYMRIAASLGLAHRFPKVVSEGQQYGILAKRVRELKLACTDINGLISRIDGWRNSLTYPKELMINNSELVESINMPDDTIASSIYMYDWYDKYLKRKGLIDFGAMLMWTVRLLDKHPEIAKREANRVEFLGIDEAQDVNAAQYAFVQHLVGKSTQVITIGDFRQRIFSFRGASYWAAKNFISDNGLVKYDLFNNYRSAKPIVEVANKLISKDADSHKDTIAAKKIKGGFELVTSYDEIHETLNVFNKIDKYIEQGGNYKDIAIIYRVNAQSRPFVDHCILNDIPYKVFEKNSFYDRPEVKDIMTYFKLAFNPENITKKEFERLANKPTRYISKHAIDTCSKYAKAYRKKIYYAIANAGSITGMDNNQRSFVYNFYKDLCTLASSTDGTSENLLGKILHEIGYKKHMSNARDKSNSNFMQDNINALLSMSRAYSKPDQLLNHYMSIRKREKKSDKLKDAITMLTVHAAKGLEYKFGVVVGMSEKIMPHRLSETAEEIQEERRVAYVAITRAEKKLLMSTINGKYNLNHVVPSRFLSEMGLSNNNQCE